MKDKFEEKTINREVLYEGKIIDLVLDDVLLPNGETSKRELVFHNGAVAIIAITPENKMILVKQYRKAVEKSILEIPAGKIEKNETIPMETAKRELEEETGYQASEMKQVAKFISSPGFSNEWLYLYEAKDLVKVDNPLPQDDDEFLELMELTLDEAKEKIITGEICDAKTLYAILYWEMQSK
ncbi:MULTISPECIES: NUDIX hydrolase [Vagococcus]|uniref:ADP-ribose pyrophosphatase n=1 Tax=Vagococcus fluvialis bH819 TaxID=1255619 RepID=A0A1X6WSE3_9ENTE|nr:MULTISPECIES: NUDIX hydrolase [Vagococcus]SLM87152.1 ADP-ribose pyrophosphatase [Vagococcus fluvialis bH819]HCM90035.1 NUDIX hydrolase [Vagococcus sp.]